MVYAEHKSRIAFKLAYAGARFVVRLWTGCTTFEVFETLPAMKAAYAID